MAVGYTMQCHW